MSEIDKVIERWDEIEDTNRSCCICRAFLRQELIAIVEKCCEIAENEWQGLLYAIDPNIEKQEEVAQVHCKIMSNKIRKELLEDK